MTEHTKEELLCLIKEDPNNAEHYQEFGKYYIQKKDYTEAERYLKLSLDIDSEDGWTYLYLGNTHNHRKEFEEALVCFQEAIGYLYNVSTPYWCSAEMYEQLEQFDEANKFYERAVEIDPECETAQVKLRKWKTWYITY